MLRTLNLKRIRTINKYKNTGIIFKGYYFFSSELNKELKSSLLSKSNKFYAMRHKAKLVWVTLNNTLVNEEPYLSFTNAADSLNLNRKIISKYLDTNKSIQGYKFFSQKP